MRELDKIKNFYNVKNIDAYDMLKSIFRVEGTISPQGDISGKIDLADSIEMAFNKTINKIQNQRNVLLTVLSETMNLERLGEYLNGMLNVAIINK